MRCDLHLVRTPEPEEPHPGTPLPRVVANGALGGDERAVAGGDTSSSLSPRISRTERCLTSVHRAAISLHVTLRRVPYTHP